MAGAAQHRVHRIAECAFEPVPIGFAVGLHMTEGRLDHASSSDHRAQVPCNSASQSRVIDLHAIYGDTLVASINNGHFRLHVAYDCRTAPVPWPAYGRHYGLPGIERAPITSLLYGSS